ncbi:mucin-5B [Pelobates cultripes]|uniref:Mucin-5B n=1 Tax=Pelobates cultripes TaxID=61616 RepID=A0AAD1TKJ6_PELCU|nr:mucin-5B [Pelobates cultripes]
MGTPKGIPLWILSITLGSLNAQFWHEGNILEESSGYIPDNSGQQQTTPSNHVNNTLEESSGHYSGDDSHEHNKVTGPPRISIIPPIFTTPVVKAINMAHNNKVCSTWGNFHYKNFDGDIFYFPGTCNYVFSSHCKSAYEDFNIQIQRSVVDSVPVISMITMKIDGLDVQINSSDVKIKGEKVALPYSRGGVKIEKNPMYLQVSSILGLVLMYNQDESLLLELDQKYANHTCGLCGDYNSLPTNNEFISNDVRITETQFGNLQKMDGPTEFCLDLPNTPESNCTDHMDFCNEMLFGTAFTNCHSLVDVEKYIEACVKDLCLCELNVTMLCLCDTFAEYSRQCAHAGGQPQNWRTPDLCPKNCPFNMEYKECGSPCADTCSNPDRGDICEDHCLEGCFCPPGTVFDDIRKKGCIPTEMCPCAFKKDIYASGDSYSTSCSNCTCSAGKWSCNNLPCPSTCSIKGGSHITTYDQTPYNIFGDCNYVLSKDCNGHDFTILAELLKCGLTDTETCLKGVTLMLNGEKTIVVIKPCGSVYVNNIYTQLPFSAANITIFRPTSFYIVLETNLGIQIMVQLIPLMQVYVTLDPSLKTKTCGLCGNFNDKQTDDFQTINGVIEGTAASFANTWKTQASCPNIKNIYEDPCSLSVENEIYAQHWCALLDDPAGPFADCHSHVNPDVYIHNCVFDTCNCKKSEDCMCAALSSYVHACAAKGIILTGWRSNVCSQYMNTCPKTLNYTYSVTTCQPTCRSLSEPDVTCNIQFVPVDGCTCTEGYYIDDSGKCISAAACPCYYRGSVVPSGEVVHDNGIQCTCNQGALSCIGAPGKECPDQMIYFDCKTASFGTRGAECQKSCQTLDMECYSTTCVSGCVCPEGLVLDRNGYCIAEENCPCIHNEGTYPPGDTIKIKCNNCTCKGRMWECTNEPCLGTCTVYGDGHYITFDGKRYSFNGDCEYTLAEDHCGKGESTFRVITENIPCGTTGTTCSKAIKVFLHSYEIILTNKKVEVVERGFEGKVPYKVRHMGIYLVIEADNGLILMWDQRTSIFIKLSSNYEGTVCGLCGNYDGDRNNDFTTRSMSVVEDVIEFGNSWKFSPTCPDAKVPKDACSANPYRKSWAQKQCSIINSLTFSACHPQVDPSMYYDACVTDSCACDTGGDCECFCTAVAAYAKACGESGVCISWRTPDICPVFCDYYNPEGECDWHYKPCGPPCMKTYCNPSGTCLHELLGLEGCYPSCPESKPYFKEDEMKCVEQHGCGDDDGNCYTIGSPVPTKTNCQSCSCTKSGILCEHNETDCYCEYNSNKYKYNDVIYNTPDGTGGCITAVCMTNGTIYRDIYACPASPASTPFTFTTIPSTLTTETTFTPTACNNESCKWSQWFNVDYPEHGNEGDFETFTKIKEKGYDICSLPKNVECRAKEFPDISLNDLKQKVQCDATFGLSCYKKDQFPPICYDYEIRVECCSFEPCVIDSTSITPSTTTPTTEVTTRVYPTTATTAPFTFTTTPSTMTTETTFTPLVCNESCNWSQWFNVDYPELTREGDLETFAKIKEKGYNICSLPKDVECRAKAYPNSSLNDLKQKVQCDATFGLSCYNKDQFPPICLDYEIRVQCCIFEPCVSLTTSIPTTYEHSTALSTKKGSTIEPTTSKETSSTAITVTNSTPYVPTSAPTRTDIRTNSTVPIITEQSETTTTERVVIKHYTSTAQSEGPQIMETTSVISTKITQISEKTPSKMSLLSTTINDRTSIFCNCHVNNSSFSPGDVIYNQTDEDGCNFYAICNKECKIDRFPGTCIVSTTPNKEPISTTPDKGCPPRKINETWFINNCTVATCHENNVITIKSVSCPPVQKPTCANNIPPVQVYSPDGCCYHYECQCVCIGWGDPHYITFDGTYYTFLDNCTYVLVQQINPRFDNFRVLIDNYFCGTKDGLSCPQSILIYYKDNEVVLTRILYNGVMTNRIRFNQNWVTPGFSMNGIFVTSAGINMIVDIPEIHAHISFSGMIFEINLPFSLFGYNTEGQCGTCSNNRTEDCRLPNGKITSDCSQMAYHWNATDNPYCNLPHPMPSLSTVSPSPTTACPHSSVCDVILSNIFAECHKIINPGPFHKGCLFDACRILNDSVACTSIQIYASMCTSNGICVDWRQGAGNHCPYNCPAGKIYNACGPAYPTTCENGKIPLVSKGFTEGCYCPSGTKLFNSFTDVCVEKCSCVGPDGMPKQPAETWTSNCQNCTCEETSLTVQCKPVQCEKHANISCNKEGFILVQTQNPNNTCCIQNQCSCDRRLCTNQVINCPLGFTSVPILLEGDCCFTYQCKPMNVCVSEGAVHQPGNPVAQKSGSCKECMCTNKKDTNTMLNLITCKSIFCNKDCSKGSKYEEVEGQCCGKCVEVACTIFMDAVTTIVIEPNKTFSINNCSYYECKKTNEQFVSTRISKECSVRSQDDCRQGYRFKELDDQCCGTCVQVDCITKLEDNSFKVLKPAETWTNNCQQCICEETSLTVQCKPVQCENPSNISCDKEGFILVQTPDPNQPCCSQNECSCDRSLCTNQVKNCPLGFTSDPVLLVGDCCFTYECKPLNVCVSEEAIYQPGSPVAQKSGSCKECMCTTEKDTNTMLNLITCKSISCNKDCLKGYKYEEVEDQCCGKCVQVACTIIMDAATTIVIEPNKTYSINNCSYYECNKTNEQFVSTRINKECSVRSQDDCRQGYRFKEIDDQCCGTCVQVDCITKLEDNSFKVLKPAETWTNNCQQCICEETSLTVQCKPVQCENPTNISCDKEGYILIQTSDPNQPCCSQNKCICNRSLCTNQVLNCPLGFTSDPVLLEGDCCFKYECKPMNVCVSEESIYQPGNPVFQKSGSCKECMCTDEKDTNTMLNLITCKSISCDKECSKGYIYEEVEGECCGKCVQVACAIFMDAATTIVIEPSETYSVNNCSYYECKKTNEQFVATRINKECSVMSQDDCLQGYRFKKLDNQCCGTCEQVDCIIKLEDNSFKALKPEEIWIPPNEDCISYECHKVEDRFVTVTVKKNCSIQECDTGFEYKVKHGECCGECIKIACTMKMNDNTTITLQSGEKYIPQDDTCTTHTCTDTYDVITLKEICPDFDPTHCLEGTIKVSENGCCKTCDTVGCQVRKQSTHIQTKNCSSNQIVELTYCEGRCNTTSIYSADANAMEHKCSCCQETKTSERHVSLTCSDGTSSLYSYLYVEKCGCTSTQCENGSNTLKTSIVN